MSSFVWVFVAAAAQGGPARGAGEVSIYAYRSSKPLDYTSPRSLIRTVLGSWKARGGKDVSSSHFTGHVVTEIRCSDAGGHEYARIFAGVTGGDHDVETIQRSLSHGGGFDPLLEPFTDGRIEDSRGAEGDLVMHAAASGWRQLRLRVSGSTCRRLLEYYDEFKAGGYARNFGFFVRPLYREGAGCSSFAMSFLEVAGLLRPEWSRAWVRTLRLPKSYFTRYGHSSVVGSWMHLPGILLRGWAEESEPHVTLAYWDPNLIYDWIGALWDRRPDMRARPMNEVSSDAAANVKSIQMDFLDKPTPTGPIFLAP